MQICLPGGSAYFEVLVLTFSISVECMDYFQGSWLHILCGCLLCQFLPGCFSIIRDFPHNWNLFLLNHFCGGGDINHYTLEVLLVMGYLIS